MQVEIPHVSEAARLEEERKVFEWVGEEMMEIIDSDDATAGDRHAAGILLEARRLYAVGKVKSARAKADSLRAVL